MDRGFVTFTTGGKYLELCDILVQSLMAFSRYPVTIYALNTEVPFTYSNIDRIISRELPHLDLASICYEKLFAAFDNSYNYGVMVDADSIANKGIDVLFEEALLVKEFPWVSEHPCDPNNQSDLMQYFKVAKKTQPYVHASTFLFSEISKPFLRECHRTAVLLRAQNMIPINLDETILNVKLWAAGCTEYAQCYDPFYKYVEFYLGEDLNQKNSPLYTRDRALFFHGCKSPSVAAQILLRLKEFHGLC